MLLSQNESSLTHLLLYGDPKRNSNVNAFILNTVIKLYYLQEDSMDRYLTELKMFFSFSNSFFIWLSLCFCLFIPFCYLSFVLISQVCVTFHIWFCLLNFHQKYRNFTIETPNATPKQIKKILNTAQFLEQKILFHTNINNKL